MLFSSAHFSFCHVTVLWWKKLGFFSVNRRRESNFAYSTGIKQITFKFLQERWFQSVGAAYLTWSAYHLNGIIGEFFWTNGTALFLTKKTERIEPYHLIRSFGCKCFPAPLSSKARIVKAKVKHKNRRPKLKTISAQRSSSKCKN